MTSTHGLDKDTFDSLCRLTAALTESALRATPRLCVADFSATLLSSLCREAYHVHSQEWPGIRTKDQTDDQELMGKAADAPEQQATTLQKACEQSWALAVKYSRQVDQYVALTEELRRWREAAKKAHQALELRHSIQPWTGVELVALKELRVLLNADKL